MLAGRANGPAQVFSEAHHGRNHIDFFNAELAPITHRLGPGFRALEVGAGMGWHAAMFAGSGAGAVIATELDWGPGNNPFSAGNASTFRRLRELGAPLGDVVQCDGDRAYFDSRLRFVRARAEALPARDASLDLVYTYNCLEHIPGLETFADEVARVLRVGGIFYSATEPLYYSPHGHHLWDILPAPWAHLLWEAEELAEVAVREAGPREWAPGVPLEPGHLAGLLREGLNFAAPVDIRGALARGPWRVLAWREIHWPAHRQLARDIGLRDALRGIPEEALLLEGLRFWLERRPRAEGLRLALRMPWTWRAHLKRIVRRGNG